MSKDTMEFLIYMIHACAKKWNQPPTSVYKQLKTSNCIGNYLVPNYEVLHTQGTDFVVDDIEQFIGMKEGAI